MVERVLQLNKEKTIFWTLLGVLFVSLSFYMYFINATIHNVVLRQDLETESSAITLAIGNKEFQYISNRNAVTLELAYNLGFKEVSTKSFISKSPSTKVALLSE